MIAKLLAERYNDVVAVDNWDERTKLQQVEGLPLTAKVHRDHLSGWLESNHRLVQFIFHLGARTDTTEMDEATHMRLNYDYSRQVWHQCVKFGLPLVYASSAGTYGSGAKGWSDNHDLIPELEPLNPYARSKQAFDLWALEQEDKPYFWAGLKFFNVYGPGERFKGRMSSVVRHAWQQIKETGQVKLFESHHPDYPHGGQKRDFIYVKDVVEVMFWLMLNRKPQHNGIYNLGTGRARTFRDLTEAVFAALEKEPKIEFIPTPEDIRDKYQYFTEAKMEKLRSIGYSRSFTSLEEGVREYVQKYLEQEKYRYAPEAEEVEGNG